MTFAPRSASSWRSSRSPCRSAQLRLHTELHCSADGQAMKPPTAVPSHDLNLCVSTSPLAACYCAHSLQNVFGSCTQRSRQGCRRRRRRRSRRHKRRKRQELLRQMHRTVKWSVPWRHTEIQVDKEWWALLLASCALQDARLHPSTGSPRRDALLHLHPICCCRERERCRWRACASITKASNSGP